MRRARPRHPGAPALAASGLLGLFFVAERRLRVDTKARDLSTGEEDRGSTAAVGGAFGSAIVAAPLASLAPWSRLPPAARWAGVPVMAAGIGLRMWSAKTLGENYTRTLQVRTGQTLVDAGPYRVLRHPGYAADIAMWAGWGLTWGTWIGWGLAVVPSLVAYVYRVRVEEDMLTRRLGPAYRKYQARTSRLVPGVW